MAPVPKNTKFHFTHPNHPLLHHSDDHQDYICDGCKTSGSGSRFRCHACDFDLHEYCANCPQKLPSFVHHHPLDLAARQNDRICDICRDPAEGLLYRCKDCDFDVHPLCTQLPDHLRHVIDPKHSLKHHKAPFGSCVVCKIDCSSVWVYGCHICGLNIHLDCLLEPYVSPAAPPPSSGCTSRGIPTGRPGPSSFPYGFDPPFGNPNYPFGGHPYGHATPYGVPDYRFGYYCGFPHGYPYNYYVNHHQVSQYGYTAPPPPPQSGGGKLGKSMFSLVGRLSLGVLTSFIFGSPIDFYN